MDWRQHLRKRVIAHRILADKPQHSGTKYGYILEKGPRDPAQREPCGAVGILICELTDGIMVIDFSVSESYFPYTYAFAHPDDLELTEADRTWPDNDGLVIVPDEVILVQQRGAFQIYQPVGEPTAPAATDEKEA